MVKKTWLIFIQTKLILILYYLTYYFNLDIFGGVGDNWDLESLLAECGDMCSNPDGYDMITLFDLTIPTGYGEEKSIFFNTKNRTRF